MRESVVVLMWSLFVLVVTEDRSGNTSSPQTCHTMCEYRAVQYEGVESKCCNLTDQELHCLSSIPLSTQTLKLVGAKLNLNRPEVNRQIELPLLRTLTIRRSTLTHAGGVLNMFNNKTRSRIASLDLSGNDINSVDIGYLQDSAPNLRYIDLSGNNLESLNCDRHYRNNNLEILALHGNKFTRIADGTFGCLSHLVELDLSSNSIGPNLSHTAFASLKLLKILNLSNNNLTTISKDAFLSNIHLKELTLSGNVLDCIPSASLCHLPGLRHLSLDNNRIQKISSSIRCLSAVWFLYLHHNLIGSIDDDAFSGLHNLKALWLNNNSLETLPSSLRHVFLRMDGQHINLSGNELVCDCRLIWLVSWLYQSQMNEDRMPLCRGPAALSGKSLDSLRPRDMICQKACVGVREKMTCTHCPPLTAPVNMSAASPVCLCVAGYQATSVTSCQACPAGSYSDTPGSLGCHTCPPGSFTHLKASDRCECQAGFTPRPAAYYSCEPCPANTYKPDPGPSACLPCPPFSTANPGANSSTSCVCTHGHAAAPSTGITECKPPILPDLDKLHLGRWRAAWFVSCLVGGAVVVLLPLVAMWLRVLWRSKRPPTKEAACVKTVETMVAPPTENGLYAHYEEPLKSLELGRVLGQGAFGQVYEATVMGVFPGNDRPLNVAVKCLRDLATREEEEALRSELEVMKCVGHHPNIITLLGAYTSQGRLMLIMEYASRGNLLSYLQARSRDEHTSATTQDEWELPWLKQVLSFAHQVALGMEHLANMKCVHRDLAARNVLLAEGLTAKVSDFGLSRDVYEVGYYFNHSKGRLPFKWMSPESLRAGHYTVSSDVWSYGILLWEISTLGGSPYPGLPAQRLGEMLSTGYRMRRPSGCPIQLYDLMLHCWHTDPSQRPTFEQLSGHMLEQLNDSGETEVTGNREPVEEHHRLLPEVGDSLVPPHQYLEIFSPEGDS